MRLRQAHRQDLVFKPAERVRPFALGVVLVVAMAVPVVATATAPSPPAAAAASNARQALGVSCTSTSFCMAVGTAATSTLTETWDGSVWSIVPSPSPSSTGNSLTSVSCMSPLDCVAVGDYTDTTGTSEGLAEIWNGSTWSVVPTVSEGGDDVVLQSVSCAPSTFCVAVGDVSAPANYSEAEPLAETWDGTNWSEDLLPPSRTIRASSPVCRARFRPIA